MWKLERRDSIIQARKLLRLLREGPATPTDLESAGEKIARAAKRLALSVCNEHALSAGIATEITNEKIVTESADAGPTSRRVIYQVASAAGYAGFFIYRIEQERKTVWQTTKASQVKSGAKTLEELQAELDRLAPIDPRD